MPAQPSSFGHAILPGVQLVPHLYKEGVRQQLCYRFAVTSDGRRNALQLVTRHAATNPAMRLQPTHRLRLPRAAPRQVCERPLTDGAEDRNFSRDHGVRGNYVRNTARTVGQMRPNFQASRSANPHPFDSIEQAADE